MRTSLGTRISSSLVATLVVACLSEQRIEGTEPGDCSDDADNDADGLFDCADPGCEGASACAANEPLIVGGEITRAFASTGALTLSGQPFCSATLVAPTKVLTAAHCLDNQYLGEVRFVIGSLPLDPGASAYAQSAVVHFAWNGDVADGNDLAVITLASAIAEVQPAVLHLGAADGFVGDQMTLVGYGSLSDGQSGAGIRRSATVTLDAVTAQTLMYDYKEMMMGACKGDSGGPAFVQVGTEWRQIGVTSWGYVPCTGEGHYQRLDIHADWLAEQGIGGDNRSINCSVDNTCDGQCEVDEDCWELMCEQGSCVASPGQCIPDGVCDQSCGSSDPDCGGPDLCAAYGLYGNGWCDLGCPQVDPDCANQCIPTYFQFDPYSLICYYFASNGQACGYGPAYCDPYYGCYC